MPHPLDPRGYGFTPTYKYLNKAIGARWPRTWTGLITALALLVLLDHWFIWWVLIGGGIVLVGWLIRIVIYRTGRF